MPAPLIIIHSLEQVPSLSALASLQCERLGLNYLHSLFQDWYLQIFSYSVLDPHWIINCRVILTQDFIIWAPDYEWWELGRSVWNGQVSSGLYCQIHYTEVWICILFRQDFFKRIELFNVLLKQIGNFLETTEVFTVQLKKIQQFLRTKVDKAIRSNERLKPGP